MTRFVTLPTKCAVCGRKRPLTILASTNTFGGSPGLDLRPAGMARQAILEDINECDRCGYASPNLEEATPEAIEWVQSPGFAEVRSATEGPAQARLWSRWANVCLRVGEPSAAGHAALAAAWVCDDMGAEDFARSHRKQAIDAFVAARNEGVEFAEDQSTEQLVLADLHRRLGAWEAARVLLDALPADLPAPQTAVASFERKLVDRADDGDYTLADAESYGSEPTDWFERRAAGAERRWWQFWR